MKGRTAMKKIVSLTLGAVLGLTPLCAFANGDEGLFFSYDKQSRALSIEGEFGSTEHEACSVYIYPVAASGTAASDSFVPDYADITVTGANGAFKYACVLPDSYESNEYVLKVASADESWSESFMYVNEKTVQKLLSQINSANGAQSLGKILMQNLTELGISAKTFELAGADIAAILYSQKPAGGFDSASEFINILDQSTAAALLKNGGKASEILKEYAKAILIDFEKDYAQYDADVKSFIDSGLEKADYTADLLAELYPQIRCVGFVKSAGTWQALKNAFYGVDSSGEKIVPNFEVINPDTTKYDKVTNKDDVFTAMFRRRSELESIGKIRSVFKECAAAVYDSENDGGGSKGSGSSGAGGSGAVSGNVSIDPGYINQAPSVQSAGAFSDVPSGEWYYASIEKLHAMSLINGYEDKTFRPDNHITRAEYTKLITDIASYLGFDMNNSAEGAVFSDVDATDWFYEAVGKASSSGLVEGSDGRFNPDEQITRQDAATILYRFVSQLKEISARAHFADNADIAGYAAEAVGALSGAGIISGMGDGRFAPADKLTRAQAAKLLCGTLEYLS